MTLTITDTTMTSDQTTHVARQAPGPQRGWEVSWLPGQILNRNTAITAMSLADTAGAGDLRPGHRLWPTIESWSAELGLAGPDAIPALPSHPQQPPARPNHPGGNPTGRPPIDQPSTTPRPPVAVPDSGTNRAGGCQRHRSRAQP